MKLIIALLLCSAATVSGFSKLRACAGFNYDECGVCRGPGRTPGTCDCDGTLPDCLGICAGSAYVDVCGVCNGKGISTEPIGEDNDALPCDCAGHTLDCAGQCGGNHTEDKCGECLAPKDHSDNGPDDCGECHGADPLYRNGSKEIYFLPSNADHPNWNQDHDCGLVCFRKWVNDTCGICGPPNNHTYDCNGECGPPNDLTINACGLCVGVSKSLWVNSSCDGSCVPEGQADDLEDDCGYCPDDDLYQAFNDTCNCIGSPFNCDDTCNCDVDAEDWLASPRVNNCSPRGEVVNDECGNCGGDGGDSMCNCNATDKTCVPPRFSNIRIGQLKPEEDSGSYANPVDLDWQYTTHKPVSERVQAFEDPDFAVYEPAFLQKNAIVGLEFRVTFDEGTEIHPENILKYDADQIFLKSYVFGDVESEMYESVELQYFRINGAKFNTGLQVIFQNCLGDQTNTDECWDFMKHEQDSEALYGYEYKIRSVACPRSTFEKLDGCDGLSEEAQIELMGTLDCDGSVDGDCYSNLPVVAENCMCNSATQKKAEWIDVMPGIFYLQS